MATSQKIWVCAIMCALLVLGCDEDNPGTGQGTDIAQDAAGDATQDTAPQDTGSVDTGGVDTTQPPVARCGDGIEQAGEGCDDGNNASGDGCAGNCIPEICGDGYVDTGETCDDAGTTPGDGCSATCQLEICGNGVLDPGEPCDGEAFCSPLCVDTREALADGDGDTISDADEGGGAIDTDGDGTTDDADDDSDGDGILDVDEVTDDNTHTAPDDTDGDGKPDFRDTDADNDGIEDSVEISFDVDGDGAEDLDVDGDGVPNARDTDSDGDGLLDSLEGSIDSDNDGIPDFLDTDSDGDGLPDSVEGNADGEGDGVPSYLDDDSDGDGVSDALEGDGDPDGDGIPSYLDTDADGDGIRDDVEGDGDPDGDGIPSFLDNDADGDGIPDALEGARDSDGDGIPDALDTDSDGDGILDITEAGNDGTQPRDTDGDGIPDYLDTDSDGDFLRDSVENSTAGLDPYNPDSDGDTIADLDDGLDDFNRDGTPNALDNDSDGDGFTDAEEAGDTDLGTFPIDSDGDGFPDYRDLDSDADGLRDALEPRCSNGNGRLTPDSDGDGFSDLAETAVGSDPCNASQGVTDIVDFYFELPLGGPEQDDPLDFTPQVQQADVFFNIDTSSSMTDESIQLRNGLGTIITQTRNRVGNAAFGVGSWEDFPVCGFGGAANGDRPFRLMQIPTTNASTAQSAVNNLTIRFGGDFPESGYESLYQVATGDGVSWTTAACGGPSGSVPSHSPGAGRVGGVSFRAGSVPMVMHVTDAVTHNATASAGNFWTSAGYRPSGISGAHSKSQTISALQGLGARVITMHTGNYVADFGSDGARLDGDIIGQLSEVSEDTGAIVPACAFKDNNNNWRCGTNRCCTDVRTSASGSGVAPDSNNMCVLTYLTPDNGNNLGTAVVDGIDAVVKYGTFDVVTQARDDGNSGTPDTSCFLKRIETLAYTPPPSEPERSCNPTPTQGRIPSNVGYNNAFLGFATGTSSASRPGASLQFRVVAQNQSCATPTTDAQVFTAFIDVVDVTTGTVLDTQEVTVIVPPEIPDEF